MKGVKKSFSELVHPSIPQTEYYVYTFGGIVGAVGGSLGMFLGFSFWQLGKDIVSKVSRQETGGWRSNERIRSLD